MENDRKRERETWNAINFRRKRQIMTSMRLNNDDDVYQIGYEWENFMGTEECYQDDESGASVAVGKGVFDFPWLKGSKDVSFKAEIDECLNSTFVTPTPTTSFCNYYDDHEINIDTTTSIASASLISCDNALFNRKNLLFQLDIDRDFNFDLDLIDQFFTDNSFRTTQSSYDDDRLKVNKIEDQQLKTKVNDDDDQLKVNKIEDKQLKTKVNDDDDQLKVNKIEDQRLKTEVNDDDDQLKVNKIEDQRLKTEVNDNDDQLKVNKIEDQRLKTEVNDDDDQLKVNKIEDQQLKTEVHDDEDQLKVNKIEDHQLKTEVYNDEDQLKVNKIEEQQLKIEMNDNDESE